MLKNLENKLTVRCLSVLLVSLFATTFVYSQNKQVLSEKTIPKVISSMNQEEKVRMVLGTKMTGSSDGGPVVGAVDTLVVGAAGATFEIPRLGVMSTVMADGPAGVRISPTRKDTDATFYCTTFPGAMSLASTWNTELVEKVGEAMGVEGKEYGIDILLTPALNIHRTPLCGRNFEYYSEDPFVSGKMAAAIINGIQKNGIGATIKHFAANNQEIRRSMSSSNMTERALREIYLRGFEIGIKESNPWAVMSSYNRINGVHASESHDLLETILRKEWGYDGFVMSDWHGGIDPVAQLTAGNDMLMPGTFKQLNKLRKVVADGTLSEDVLDKNVERILRYIVKTPRFSNYKYSDKPNLKKGAEISYQAAVEGIVLLKNSDKALPISKKSRVALFGGASYEIYKGGIGSGDVHSAYAISLYEGLKNAGCVLSADLNQKYEDFLKSLDPKSITKRPVVPRAEPEITEDDIVRLEKESDLAVLTIGRYNGEFADVPTPYYYLTKEEKKLLDDIHRIFKKNGKQVIVVLNTGGVIDMTEWNDKTDAILSTWYSGQEAGNAIADIMIGKSNPSGKLASSVALKYEDYSSSGHYPGYPIEAPIDVDYCEDIYVGYRYFNTFDVATQYEFGYGLSYTTFAYSNLKVQTSGFNKIKLFFEVKNIGAAIGKEVAQIYISAPNAKVSKPSQELKAFAKTRELKPGEIQKIEVEIEVQNLASFSEKDKAWIVDEGKYTVNLGASSLDIRLKDSFEINEKKIVEQTMSVLPLKRKMAILVP